MNNENQEKCCCSDCFVDHFGDTSCNNCNGSHSCACDNSANQTDQNWTDNENSNGGNSTSCGCTCDNTTCKAEQGWTDNENSNSGNSTSCGCTCDNSACKPEQGWTDNENSNGGNSTSCGCTCDNTTCNPEQSWTENENSNGNNSTSCGCSCDNTTCNPEQSWTDNENSNGGNSTSCNNNSNCGNNSQGNTGWKEDYESGGNTDCQNKYTDNGNTGSSGNTPPTYPGSDECTGNCGGSCCGNTEEEIWGILILDDGHSDTDKTIKQGDELLYQVRFFPWGVKEKDIVWKSSNSNVVKIADISKDTKRAWLKATGNGVAIITAMTFDGEFSDSCTITVKPNKEEVIVEDKGEYFTVSFVDGNVWKSVGCDIFEEYPNIRPWDAEDEDLPVLARNVKYNAYRTYTFKQLGLLYRLDPLGVVQYVKDYLDLHYHQREDESYWEYLGRQLTFKDEVYCAIFDVNPRQFYFYPTDDGVLSYLNYKPAVRADYFSDAEFLFGKHSIPDFDWFDFITGCIDVFFTLTSPAYVAIKSVWGAVNTCHALFAASAVEGAITDASQGLIKLYMDETYGNVEDKAKKVLGKFFKPAKFIFGCIESAVGAWDLIGAPDIEVYKSLNALEYYVVLRGKLRTLSLEEFISLCEAK